MAIFNSICANSEYLSRMTFKGGVADNGENIVNLFAEKFGVGYANHDLLTTTVSFNYYNLVSSVT